MNSRLSDARAIAARHLRRRSGSGATRRGWAVGLVSIIVLSGCSRGQSTDQPSSRPTPVPRPTVSSSGSVFPTIPLGGDAYSVEYGFGAAWIQVDPPVDAVVRVDAASSKVTLQKEGGTGVAITQDAVWMTVAGESLQKISPRTGKVLLTVKAPEAFYVSAGAGSIWVPTAGGIARVNPCSGAVKKIPIKAAVGVQDLSATKTAVWVTDKRGGQVFRVDPRKNAVVAVIRTGAGAHDLAVDRHGVWITNYQADTVSRIDPTTNKVAATIRGVGSGTGICACNGAIWASARYQGVFRIDPATNKATMVAPLNEWNYGVGCGDGELWITSTSGRVYRMAF